MINQNDPFGWGAEYASQANNPQPVPVQPYGQPQVQQNMMANVKPAEPIQPVTVVPNYAKQRQILNQNILDQQNQVL